MKTHTQCKNLKIDNKFHKSLLEKQHEKIIKHQELWERLYTWAEMKSAKVFFDEDRNPSNPFKKLCVAKSKQMVMKIAVANGEIEVLGLNF